MAQRYYAIDLQNTKFPMLSSEQTRTVIGATAGEAPSAKNRPYVSYCHNVAPSEYGLKSVGYLTQVTALAEEDSIVDVRSIFDTEGVRLYLAFSSSGAAYYTRAESTEWTLLGSSFFVESDFAPDKVTTGRVDGTSYVYYYKKGAVIFDASTNALVEVAFAGLDTANVLGLTGSSGYLLAYTIDAIAWSSTIDPTDFVPDKVTGAGGGRVANIAGAIKFTTPNSLGVLIYSEANTVAATYTGNAQFPFKFREVPASRGASSLDVIAYEANSAEQFVFSNVGLRTVTSNSSEAILPEVTDFLAGSVFEDFDEVTNTFIRQVVTGTMKKKVRYVASRYLVISYGVTEFTHALVFDVALRKLGKLKLTHVDVIDYIADQQEVARQSIGLVTTTGEIKVVDFSIPAEDSNGVVILSKLQFTRTRGLMLLGVEVENTDPEDSFTLTDSISLDGKTSSSTVEGSLVASEDNYRKYNLRATGKNHSLIFKGKFNLVTAQIIFTTAGRR